MCGIAGFYSNQKKFTLTDLTRITAAIKHRGPDAEGLYMNEVCGLGHRRLSILDLSSHANQPMHSQNDRYVIVFNGEVYNFKEIAQSLQLSTLTTSDTEVILEAFSLKGVDSIQRFNGMFSLAIYDKWQKELYLLRDRIGIKPLFYFWDGHDFAFASELKALVSLLPISQLINQSAIDHFLHLGYIPAPLTIYKNIYKLPAGKWLKVSKSGLEEHAFWQSADHILSTITQDETKATRQLDELMRNAVRYQLVSDVPLGVFLSGGIDSSLVAALAVQESPSKVKTFSIGFEESSWNESQYARAVANHLQTEHHEFMVKADDAKGLVDTMLDIYDEPYADSSAIPTMLVSKLAREYVTVALCGDGGDELFFGYGMYQWAQRLSNPRLGLLKKSLSNLLKFGKAPRYQKASAMFDFPGKVDHVALNSHIFSQEQGYFSEKEIRNLRTVKVPGELYGNLPQAGYQKKELKRDLTPMERQALFDLQYYLPDELLVKVDRATMLFGLEARVPFLDHRVVEFALNLSPDLKYRNGISKYLLKKVLYQYVPASLFDRPKRGFSIPLQKWLRTDLKYLIDDYLNEKVVSQFNIVRYAEVDKLKKQFIAGNDYLYHRIWLLIVLHRWMVKHANRSH